MHWRQFLATFILAMAAFAFATSPTPRVGATDEPLVSAGVHQGTGVTTDAGVTTAAEQPQADPEPSATDPEPPAPDPEPPAPDPEPASSPPPPAPPPRTADQVEPVPVQRPAGGARILGYYPVDYPGDRTSYRSLQGHRDSIDMAVFFGLYLDEEGDLQNLTGGDPGDIFALAGNTGTQVLVAVNNVNSGGFDGAATHRMLADADARGRSVENIYNLVRDRYAGVNLDLELLDPGDRTAYSAFVADVAARLQPEGYLVTLAVPAKTRDDRNNAWSGAFDYDALGRIADYLVIMSYDEHWAGGPAGPIASLGWVEKVARYASGHIPPQKVLLGLAAYAYDWSDQGGARGLSVPGAARKAATYGVSVKWDEAAQAPYYRYTKSGVGHVVYFENAASTAAKANLVSRYGLGGIALWRLGFEDPAIWSTAVQPVR